MPVADVFERRRREEGMLRGHFSAATIVFRLLGKEVDTWVICYLIR
jgi:hypothetical protein